MAKMAYKIPAEKTRKHRKEFHSYNRKPSETMDCWFYRIEGCLSGCNYDTLSEFMLIDKFMSGLTEDLFNDFSHLEMISVEQLLSIILPKSKNNGELDLCVKEEMSLRIDLQPENKTISSTISTNQIGVESINQCSSLVHPEKLSEQDSTKDRTSTMIEGATQLKGYKLVSECRIICLDCGIECAKNSYPDHKRWHTGNLKTCDVCSKVFASFSNYRRHIKIHKETDRIFQCYMGDFESDQYRGLRSHFTAKHCFNFNTSIEELFCSFCNKQFKSHKTLKIHERIHQGLATRLKCTQCDKEFDQRCRLTMHLQTHANTINFICEICGASFYNQKGYRTHAQSHRDTKDFECMECGIRLKTPSSLQAHMKTHSNHKPYKCYYTNCLKKFRTRALYQRHFANVHEHFKKNPCNFCDKRFPTKYHLGLHMTVHTGARNYVCNICSKSYGHPATLRNHKLREHPK